MEIHPALSGGCSKICFHCLVTLYLQLNRCRAQYRWQQCYSGRLQMPFQLSYASVLDGNEIFKWEVFSHQQAFWKPWWDLVWARLLVLNLMSRLELPSALPLSLPIAAHCQALTSRACSMLLGQNPFCLAALSISLYGSVATWAKFWSDVFFYIYVDVKCHNILYWVDDKVGLQQKKQGGWH